MADTNTPQMPSRYKSQRRKQTSVDENQATERYSSPPGDDGIARSKSRYHRKPGTSSGSPPDTARPASQQHQDNIPTRYHSKHRDSPLKPLYQEQIVQAPAQHRRTSSNAKQQDDRYASPPAGLGARDLRSFTSDAPGSDAENHLRQRSSNRESNSRRNADPMPPSSPPQASPPPAMLTGELFPPPRPVEAPVRKDGPPQSGNIRATKSMSELPVYEGEHEAGCFGGLFRRKKGEDPASPGQKVSKPLPKSANGEPPTIRPGGGGIVPGTDAPISAINAGDRHVLVECGKSKALFPVTPTTTPVDIIKSAATCMSERIDVKSAVLLEYFGTVGVQRPLRRYEHIRDMMNSWDHDKQNSLLLVDPGTGSLEAELTLAGVPKAEPEEQSWFLSYSQKVGKWEKRFITLRSNGQIVCQKDPDKSKDLTNVCHLSDFDIYTPTQEKIKKKIKPPKKNCFAIKSQQKTSLFESTENFVHFFSTGDRATADSFYDAVQAWRSWYLVNVMGEGKKEKPNPAVTSTELRDRSTSNNHSKTHRPNESMDSHYQLGSFKPLMDMGQFDRSASNAENDRPGSSGRGFVKSANQFDVNVSPERRASTNKKQHPPMSLKNKAQLAEDEPLANLDRSRSTHKRRSSMDQKRPEPLEFSDKGLLGRNYSQRRKEISDRENEKQQAFVAGPNLLNGGLSPRESEFGQTLAGDGLRRQPSARGHTSSGEVRRSKSTRDNGRSGGHARGSSIDLERSASRRQKPKPLVDLTPQYKEPPQHTNKGGRGFNPTAIGAGGLIENATSPEDPLGIPQNNVFRNTSGQYSAQNSPGLIDLTPQHREPIHHTKKGKGYHVDAPGATGLVGHASSPEDPLGLPQNNVFRSMNAMPEGRRRAGSVSEASPPVQRRLSAPRAPEGFTGEGLLAASQNRQGWGTTTKGRGVIDGSRAGGKPLVDLTADSRFVQGSLLNQVERAEGIPAPIIDREKRVEKNEKYGEGY